MEILCGLWVAINKKKIIFTYIKTRNIISSEKKNMGFKTIYINSNLFYFLF